MAIHERDEFNGTLTGISVKDFLEFATDPEDQASEEEVDSILRLHLSNVIGGEEKGRAANRLPSDKIRRDFQQLITESKQTMLDSKDEAGLPTHVFAVINVIDLHESHKHYWLDDNYAGTPEEARVCLLSIDCAEGSISLYSEDFHQERDRFQGAPGCHTVSVEEIGDCNLQRIVSEVIQSEFLNIQEKAIVLRFTLEARAVSLKEYEIDELIADLEDFIVDGHQTMWFENYKIQESVSGSSVYRFADADKGKREASAEIAQRFNEISNEVFQVAESLRK